MLDELKENWPKIKKSIRDEYEVTSVSYKTWIEPLEIYDLNGQTVRIMFPGENSDNDFAINYIKKKYSRIIQVMIEEVSGLSLNVELIPEPKKDQNHLFMKNVPAKSGDRDAIERQANLNPKYTFDSFVVGANNQFAHAASLSVAENPGKEFNPLFIYGGPGLGKTHLMHSIAHFILDKNPEARIQYVTSEVFTNELINAIQNRNRSMNNTFKEKYRNVDVLLIDDVQFIIKSESTQEEFFHTFNSLRENGKQIVLSSDRPPRDFTTLEERLRSRFESGLSVDITAPDYETRMAILRKKEEMEGYTIDNEILQYIATNIKTNIRELEGALTKMYAYSKLHPGTPITLDIARENLKDIINPEQEKKTRPDHIIQVVADHYNIRPEDIKSQKRNSEIVLPRQICMYLIRVMNDISLKEVGEALGKRDHSTIIHGYEKILKEMSENKDLDREIEILKKKLLE